MSNFDQLIRSLLDLGAIVRSYVVRDPNTTSFWFLLSFVLGYATQLENFNVYIFIIYIQLQHIPSYHPFSWLTGDSRLPCWICLDTKLHKFCGLGTPKQGITFENFTPKQGK